MRESLIVFYEDDDTIIDIASGEENSVIINFDSILSFVKQKGPELKTHLLHFVHTHIGEPDPSDSDRRAAIGYVRSLGLDGFTFSIVSFENDDLFNTDRTWKSFLVNKDDMTEFSSSETSDFCPVNITMLKILKVLSVRGI